MIILSDSHSWNGRELWNLRRWMAVAMTTFTLTALTHKIEDPNKLSEIVSNRNFGIGSDGLYCY